jgi:uncharacterized protein (TIGR00369 family)
MTAIPSPDALQQTLGLVQRHEPGADGRARLEYEASMTMCHSGGVVQGGFVAGWIDAAMAMAAMSAYGADVVPMTLEMKTSYFAPARPGRVIAEGWIERRGRSTCFAEGRLLDPDGRVIAKASTTLQLVDRARVEAAAKASRE